MNVVFLEKLLDIELAYNESKDDTIINELQDLVDEFDDELDDFDYDFVENMIDIDDLDNCLKKIYKSLDIPIDGTDKWFRLIEQFDNVELDYEDSIRFCYDKLEEIMPNAKEVLLSKIDFLLKIMDYETAKLVGQQLKDSYKGDEEVDSMIYYLENDLDDQDDIEYFNEGFCDEINDEDLGDNGFHEF